MKLLALLFLALGLYQGSVSFALAGINAVNAELIRLSDMQHAKKE